MNERSNTGFEPDYLVTPGEILEEYLDSLKMSQVELSARTGLAKKTVNEIIKGKAPITPETALKLERTLGRPAHFWNNLERQYQEDRARIEERARMLQHLEWLKKIPLRAMIKQGWIEETKDKSEQLETVLRFFGLASPDQWQPVWKSQVSYRQSQRFEKNAHAVSAWLRRGELLAREIGCAPFNRAQFQSCLHQVRSLMRETTDVFCPKLVDMCRNAGVAVVFVPELPRTGIYGATRWIGGKAVIQLSLRYKSNDHLWFTFFHEAGHILLHGKKDVFIEGDGCEDEREEAANEFAADILIPPNDYTEFVATTQLTETNITAFARDIGIAPGIVVGRLQHDDLLPPNRGNKLKVFYRWTK
jgi:addiction module HigA family antidote